MDINGYIIKYIKARICLPTRGQRALVPSRGSAGLRFLAAEASPVR